MSADDEFKIWQSSQPPANGQLDRRGATLKVGPRVCKTVTICDYGDVDTGTISKRELRVETARRLPDSTFGWGSPERSWSCANEEIDKLIAFLTENVAEPGTYRLVAKAVRLPLSPIFLRPATSTPRYWPRRWLTGTKSGACFGPSCPPAQEKRRLPLPFKRDAVVWSAPFKSLRSLAAPPRRRCTG